MGLFPVAVFADYIGVRLHPVYGKPIVHSPAPFPRPPGFLLPLLSALFPALFLVPLPVLSPAFPSLRCVPGSVPAGASPAVLFPACVPAFASARAAVPPAACRSSSETPREPPREQQTEPSLFFTRQFTTPLRGTHRLPAFSTGLCRIPCGKVREPAMGASPAGSRLDGRAACLNPSVHFPPFPPPDAAFSLASACFTIVFPFAGPWVGLPGTRKCLTAILRRPLPRAPQSGPLTGPPGNRRRRGWKNSVQQPDHARLFRASRCRSPTARRPVSRPGTRFAPPAVRPLPAANAGRKGECLESASKAP